MTAGEMREAAAMACLRLAGERGCDCDTCDCGNIGTASCVASHDAMMFAAAAIRAIPIPSPWRDIASDPPPMDGSSFMAYWPSPHGTTDAWNMERTWVAGPDMKTWHTPTWYDDFGHPNEPTHWMPLPPAPEPKP